jgi:hypothetical protein
VLLVLNLLRWVPGGPWTPPAMAHPVLDEPVPALPETVMTSYDEDWEATELAGTLLEGRGFGCVPIMRPPGPGPAAIEKLGVAATFLKDTLDPKGSAEMKEGGGLEKKDAVIGAAAALAVTHWRVRGHMHRGRGRP